MFARLGVSLALVTVAVVVPLQVADANTRTATSLGQDAFEYYVDPIPQVAPGTKPRSQGQLGATRMAGTESAEAGLAIPVLHSRAGSTHKIYLDFDGVTLGASNAWVTDPTAPIPAGSYGGFSLDGDPAFDATEIAYIQKVWKIVSEKYSPFDLDVTTVDPGIAGYSRSSGADTAYGDHVVITDDPAPVNAVCGGSCAGVAYVNTFDVAGNANYEPAWVFSSKTFGSAQLTAHDAAHEVGHTLGLGHDGDTAHPEYYPGHANWIPIMGLTNQHAVAQFSKGEYANASNNQDDLAIIGANGNNGAAGSLILADDYATTGGTPTALGDQTAYTVDGIITNAADDDIFSIARTCTSAMTATATGIGAGQSLDIKLDLLDNSNNVLATNNPASGQNTAVQPDGDIGYLPTGMDAAATLASTTAATTYRIRVDGSNNGTGATGYTTYGSIGQYHLTITGCPAGATPGAPATAGATPNSRTTTGTVNWTAPASDGGSPITGYKVSGLPGGPFNLGNVLSYDATNLVPGTTYTVDVQAVNINGPGLAKSTTLRVDTWAPLTKPGLTASLAGSTATLTWTAPANPGGATLTGWHVVGSGPGNSINEILAAGTLTKNYPGLAVGTQTFTVTGTYTADDTAGIVSSDPKSVVVTATPAAPATASATPDSHSTTGTINWTAPASDGGSPITGYKVSGLPGGPFNLGNVLTYDATNLVPGTTYTVGIQAVNVNGPGTTRSTSLRVDTWAPTTKPVLTVTRSGFTATLSWTVPANPGHATLTKWKIHRSGPGLSPADKELTAPVMLNTTTMAGLAVGTQTFTVTPVYTADDIVGVQGSDPKSLAVPAVKPSAPRIGTASSGARGGYRTAVARWAAPLSTGGAAITSYKVVAYKLSSTGKVVRTYVSSARSASARSYNWRLPRGRYKFRVVAYNKMGGSPYSGYSRIVTSR